MTTDWATFYRAENYFGCAVTRRQQHFGSYASAYSTDVADEPVNNLVIRQAPASPDQLLREAQKFFSATGVRFGVVIRADLLNEAIGRALQQAGFSYSETSVAMVLPLSSTQKPDWTHVQQMDARLDEWVAPLISYGPYSLAAYRDCHELALSRGCDLRHFCLFHDDKAVCSMTLSFGDDWVRIDDVATLPAQQRRGFARRLLHFAIELAASEGKKLACLEASKQGLALYRQMGFVPVFENHLFVTKT